MTDREYFDNIAKLKLSAEKKNDIKQKLRLAAAQNAPTHERSEKKPWHAGRFAFIGTLCTVIVTVVVLVSVLLLQNSDVRTAVDHPISAEDKNYLINTAENAQYLPNAEILDATSSTAVATSHSGISDVIADGNSVDGRFDEAYSVSDELDFGLEDYALLNDALAYVGVTSTDRAFSIYDVKKEILLMMDILPGYSQWFTLPEEMPQEEEENLKNYSWHTFRLDYDKESGKISMKRLSWKTVCNAYDKESDKFFVTDDGSYQRQLLEVEYYTNENGREVVDCTVTNYVALSDGRYYPTCAQRLINVENCSFTKYSSVYMREYRLEDNDLLRYAYDLSEICDYGINTTIVQLDYTSSEDVSLIKCEYYTGDSHYGTETAAAISYYSKTGEDALYYVSKWDNIEDFTIYDIGFANTVHVDRGDNGDPMIDRKAIVDSFSYTMSIRWNMLCEECEKNQPSDDGVFVDCKHHKLGEEVNRAKNQIFSTNAAHFAYADAVYGAVAEKFNDFAVSLGVDARLSVGDQVKFSFENSVNEYIVAFGKEYKDKYVETSDYGTIDRYTLENSSSISQEELNGILSEKYNFISGANYICDMKGIEINVDYVITFNLSDTDENREYYVATVVEYDNDPGSIVIAEKMKIDPASDTSAELKHEMTIYDFLDKVLELKPQFERDDEFRLKTAVISIGADGIVRTETTLRSLKFDVIGANFVIDRILYCHDGDNIYAYCITVENDCLVLKFYDDFSKE